MTDYLNNFNLSGKTVFIIGSNGLIGSEIVKSCLDAGAKIICLDIKKNKTVYKNSKKIFFEKFNVEDLDKVEFFLLKIVKKYGPPNCLVNASYPKTKDWPKNSYKKITLKSFKKNVLIHMNSYIWIAKIIADLMVKKKVKNASIVQLSSIYGILGQDGELYKNTKMSESMSYAAIKGGINNSIRSMAAYYGKYNIRVNSICAGGVYDLQTPIFLKIYNKKTPLRRMANPNEIATSSLFLLSNASSYITGTNLIVDGGFSIL
jgi:NAD(P)-dependent dehydrogenase (short-subunit alcohol dehydrogenase family)